jgi:hypothetical protein
MRFGLVLSIFRLEQCHIFQAVSKALRRFPVWPAAHKTLGIDGTDQEELDHSVAKGDAKPFFSIRTKNIYNFLRSHFVIFLRFGRGNLPPRETLRRAAQSTHSETNPH